MKKIRKKTKDKQGKVWEKPFVYSSIIIIAIIGLIYAYRLIHYYREFNHIEEAAKFVDIISNKKNIVYHGDGLYKEDENTYYYYGKASNNYLKYEGLLWRIISIDEKKIKLITDESLTNLVWGSSGSYSTSLINDWLNKDSLIKNVSENEKTLTSSFCDEAININKYDCDKMTDMKIGLISTKEYLKAGGDKSYLNNGTYFWTINTDEENKAYYVHTEGGINNDIGSENSRYSYGVRPVINIDIDIPYIIGDGTINDPYVISNTMVTTLKTVPIGSYITYNNLTFRVSIQGDEYTKIILDGYLKDNDEPVKVTYNEVNSYLRDKFIKLFDETELVKIKFNKTEYNSDKKYNYKNSYNSYESTYGLPVVGDLFINDYAGYWLDTYYDKNQDLIYTTYNNSTLLADLGSNEAYIRPIIAIKNNLNIIDGKGTKESPYVIGN